jgi:hypothetical protein
MMLAARARPPVQRLDGNKSICILPKAAMKPCQKQAARDFDYDGLAWVIATVYATTISVLPSPVELKTGVGAMRFRSGASHRLPARNGAGPVRPAS